MNECCQVQAPALIIKMQNKISLCLASSWTEHYGGWGTSSVPQLGQGLCLDLSSLGMGVRLKKICGCMFVWLSDVLKRTWNTEVFLAGGCSLVCERSSLTYGLLYYLPHSGEPYSWIMPSKFLAQSKPRARQCLRQTQCFPLPAHPAQTQTLTFAEHLWNVQVKQILFLQLAVAAALTQPTAWLQV